MLARLLAVSVIALCTTALAVEPEPPDFPAEQIEFFENQVRPLLAEFCYECHSQRSETLQAGLRVDARPMLLEGGDSGPAVVAGKPDDSLLVSAVRWESFEMPPGGKLSDEQVAVLAKWVEWGAPWPNGETALSTSAAADYDWDKFRNKHWAFAPLSPPLLPAIDADRPIQNEVDMFLSAQLDAAGLQPVEPAPPRVLLRRMHLDLVGLPPTPEEVAQFEAACVEDRNAAIDGVTDHLLQSPHYGERWARHWLDVARYSDGFGGFLDNSALEQAWRYRDWVVQALNEDLPYDQFIKLQIAGDLLADREGAVATGFFALGPTYRSDGGDPDSVAQARAETLSDRLDTLGRGILGLTLACARCHDHKFDPLPQQDFYSLAGVFNNTRIADTPLVSPEVVKTYNEQQQAIKDVDKRVKDEEARIKMEKREPDDVEQRQLDRWREELDQLKQTAPPKYDFAHALVDSGSSDMKVAIRGNLRRPGEDAPRRFLKILAGDEPPRFTSGSGRRELATAVAAPENPLIARVLVNRIWMHHFGAGLVRTPSNFGTLGEPPTHPALLDWLAVSLVESGWSIKQLHRTIMRSAAYQRSSRFDPDNYAADGDNRLIWRMNPRRLDIESWRDSVLKVTGELDLTVGGPATDRIDSRRRTLYFKVSRNGDVFATDEFLRLFDFPLMRATVAKRPTSIVPQQFLFLLNSDFMIDRARALGSRLERAAEEDPQRIEYVYRLLYGRPPSQQECALGLTFLLEPGGQSGTPSPWHQYLQVLLSSNEFMYMQ